jgi:hypothetical protein
LFPPKLISNYILSSPWTSRLPQGTLAIFDKRAKSVAEIVLPGPQISGCTIRDGVMTIAEQSRKTLYRAPLASLLPGGGK